MAWGALEEALGKPIAAILRRIIDQGQVPPGEGGDSLEGSLLGLRQLFGPEAGDLLEEFISLRMEGRLRAEGVLKGTEKRTIEG